MARAYLRNERQSFLISFATLFHSVYRHLYFTSITYNEVVKLDFAPAIVDAIADGDGERAFRARRALLIAPNERPDTHRILNDQQSA